MTRMNNCDANLCYAFSFPVMMVSVNCQYFFGFGKQRECVVDSNYDVDVMHRDQEQLTSNGSSGRALPKSVPVELPASILGFAYPDNL